MLDITPLRILVVDDNEVNIAVIKGMLEHLGHLVHAVSDGQSAVLANENECYDLVVMDCLMPKMDGFEAARRIRSGNSNTDNPDIPILAVTALSTIEDQTRCFDAGMSGFIGKPVVAKDLYSWIDENIPIKPRLIDYPVMATSATRGDTAAPSSNSTSNSELVNLLAETLIRDASIWQQAAAELLAGNRLMELGQLGHKIRGTADVLGFEKLSRIAVELEASGNSGNMDAAAEQVPLLVMELKNLVKSLCVG